MGLATLPSMLHCPELGLQSLRSCCGSNTITGQGSDGLHIFQELERNGQSSRIPTPNKVFKNPEWLCSEVLHCDPSLCGSSYCMGSDSSMYDFPLAEVFPLMFLIFRSACHQFSFCLSENVYFLYSFTGEQFHRIGNSMSGLI